MEEVCWGPGYRESVWGECGGCGKVCGGVGGGMGKCREEVWKSV